MEWNGLEWNHGVEWSGVDFSGVRWSRWIDGMQCSGVQWSAMEWIDGMQCSGVEWNGVHGCAGWMIRTPHVHEKIDFVFFGPPDNFHFSKVAHFFSFCEARSKMASKKRRATKFAFLKNAFLLRFFIVVLCVFTTVFKCFFFWAWAK